MTTVRLWQTKHGVEDVSDLLKERRSGSVDNADLDHVDPALRDAFISGCARVHDRSRLPKEFTGLHNGH